MKLKKPCISINLISNFKPKNYVFLKNLDIFKQNNKQIYCRNFLIFILLFKNNNTNINLHFKKKKFNTITILKSPYRHKLARHQISLNRFYIFLKISLNFKSIFKTNNFHNLLNFIVLYKNINSIFETNLIFIENINIKFNFYFNDNFFLKNFILK